MSRFRFLLRGAIPRKDRFAPIGVRALGLCANYGLHGSPVYTKHRQLL